MHNGAYKALHPPIVKKRQQMLVYGPKHLNTPTDIVYLRLGEATFVGLLPFLGL
jgi:hypothetical protein